MGKGGGGGGPAPPTESTVTQTNLPEYVQPYFEEVLERTSAESQQPYQTFPGQRLAEFSPEQEASFLAATQIGQQGIPPQLPVATFRAAQAAQYRPTTQPVFDPTRSAVDIYQSGLFDPTRSAEDISQSGKYQPGQFTSATFTDPAVAQQYMNPFVENVIDVQRQRAEQRFAEDVLPGLDARAVQQGAYGGSRAELTRGLAGQRLEDRLAEVEAGQRAQAYTAGQAAFEADQQRRLRAEQLGDTAAQQAARLGLTGAELRDRAYQQAATLGLTGAELRDRAYQQAGRMGIAGEQVGIQAAQQLSALGAQEQALGLRGADVLRQVGEQRQGFEQQGLDIQLADFISQRDFPRQQLGWYGGILHGVPVTPSQESATYRQPPDMASQLMGYGLGGLGLARSVMGA